MSIHDFIALTKNKNIDLGLRPQVDIVILGQWDKIMYRPHQHAIIVYNWQPHQHAIIVYNWQSNVCYCKQ